MVYTNSQKSSGVSFMPRSKKVKKFFCHMVLVRTGHPGVFDEKTCDTILRKEAIDWLFMVLGFFTYLYLAALALLFLGKLNDKFPEALLLVDILQEPYLGALGIYVVLKEIRKRNGFYQSKYLGELFVVLWALLFAFATLMTAISPAYQVDNLYKLIVATSSVVFLIYIGSIINRP